MAVLTPTYPTALDTVTTLGEVEDAVSSTIGTGGVDASATTVPITSTTGWPNTGMVWCGTEGISYTGKTSTSITGCVRGFRGTASTHAAGDAVYADIISSAHYEALRTSLIAVQTEVGRRGQRAYNVRAFGAVGDDSTNDRQAFLDAFAAAQADTYGGAVYVPSGKYFIDGNLTITYAGSEGVTFYGDGMERSILRTGGTTTGCIKFDSTSTSAYYKPTFVIHDLGFETSKRQAGTAIEIAFADPNSDTQGNDIYNVRIWKDLARASDQGAGAFGAFTKGIVLKDSRNGRISNVSMLGEILYSITPNSTVGIEFTAESVAQDVIGCAINGFIRGVYASGTMEGIYLFDNDIIACDIGYEFNPSSAGEPQTCVVGNSFRCNKQNILISEAMGFQIIGNHMYSSSWNKTTPYDDWTSILVQGSSLWGNILANTIIREPDVVTASTTTVGIDVQSCTRINVNDNILYAYPPSNPGYTYGIKIGASATQARVRNNAVDNATTKILNAGPSTQIETFNDTDVTHESSGDYKYIVKGATSAEAVLNDTGSGADLKNFGTFNSAGVTLHRSMTDAMATKFDFQRMQHADGLTWNANEASWFEPADRASVSVITDVFSANSAIPTIAAAWYEFEFEVWYQKGATAATTTFTLTSTQAPQNVNMQMIHSPAAGVTNAAVTSLNIAAVEGSTATAVTLVTASQTISTLQNALIKGTYLAHATVAGNFRLRITGTNVAVQKGSKMVVRRWPQTTGGWSGTTGALVA